MGSLGSSALTNFFGVVDLRFAAAPEGQPAVRMPCLPPLNTKHGENRGSTVKSVMKHGEISGKKRKKMEALVTLVGKESKFREFPATHVGSPEGLLCNHCKNCINLSGSQSVSFY